jgi:hypothetical protein
MCGTQTKIFEKTSALQINYKFQSKLLKLD